MQIPTDFLSSLGGKITLQEDREESEKLYAQVAFFFGGRWFQEVGMR